MCSQTSNSCAKAFDNQSRRKNLKPKKLRGGGQFNSPPPLKASRVKIIKSYVVASSQSSVKCCDANNIKSNQQRKTDCQNRKAIPNSIAYF